MPRKFHLLPEKYLVPRLDYPDKAFIVEVGKLFNFSPYENILKFYYGQCIDSTGNFIPAPYLGLDISNRISEIDIYIKNVLVNLLKTFETAFIQSEQALVFDYEGFLQINENYEKILTRITLLLQEGLDKLISKLIQNKAFKLTHLYIMNSAYKEFDWEGFNSFLTSIMQGGSVTHLSLVGISEKELFLEGLENNFPTHLTLSRQHNFVVYLNEVLNYSDDHYKLLQGLHLYGSVEPEMLIKFTSLKKLICLGAELFEDKSMQILKTLALEELTLIGANYDIEYRYATDVFENNRTNYPEHATYFIKQNLIDFLQDNNHLQKLRLQNINIGKSISELGNLNPFHILALSLKTNSKLQSLIVDRITEIDHCGNAWYSEEFSREQTMAATYYDDADDDNYYDYYIKSFQDFLKAASQHPNLREFAIFDFYNWDDYNKKNRTPLPSLVELYTEFLENTPKLQTFGISNLVFTLESAKRLINVILAHPNVDTVELQNLSISSASSSEECEEIYHLFYTLHIKRPFLHVLPFQLKDKYGRAINFLSNIEIDLKKISFKYEEPAERVNNNLERIYQFFSNQAIHTMQSYSLFNMLYPHASFALADEIELTTNHMKTFTANRLWALFIEHKVEFTVESFYKMIHNIFGESLNLSYFNEVFDIVNQPSSVDDADTIASLKMLASQQNITNTIHDYMLGFEENNIYRDTVKKALSSYLPPQVLGNLVTEYLESPANHSVSNAKSSYLHFITNHSYSLNAFKKFKADSDTPSQENNYGFSNSISDNYRIIDVAHDGSCFFHAVFQQLRNLALLKQHNLPLDEDEAVPLMRQRTLQHIQDNFHQYVDFMTVDFATFMQRNSNNAEWADHIVILAAAHTFNVCIHILRNDDKENIINDNAISLPTPIHIAYQVGIHYLSLEDRSTVPHDTSSSDSDSDPSSSEDEMDEDELIASEDYASSVGSHVKRARDDEDEDAPENKRNKP